MKDKKENIIIFRTDRIGEVLLSTVAVTMVKEYLPDAVITFATSEYSRSMVDGHKNVKKVLTVDTSSGKRVLLKALSLAFTLRKGRYNTAIILNPHKMLHLACFLAGIPERIGYNRKWGGLLSRSVKDERSKGAKHETEYTADLLKELGVKGPAHKPRLFVDCKAEIAVDDLIIQQKLEEEEKPLIAVHPGSSNPAKIWPEDNYVDLLKMLDEKIDCNIALIGHEETRDAAGRIIERSGIKALNSSGMFDLKELAAFLRRADLFIGSDTGPMHMAAALNVPVVAIFGRNIPGAGPRRWGPVGERHKVLHKPCDSSRCFDTECPYDHKCLKDITVDEVFKAASESLSGGK